MTLAGEAKPAQTEFTLNPVGCADCFWKIENGLKELPGVLEVGYDMGKIRFKVTFDPSKTSPSRIVKRVEDLGYRLKGKHYPTVGVLEAIRLAIRRSRARKPSKS